MSKSSQVTRLKDVLIKLRMNKAFLKKYGVEKIGVFGSIARNEAKKTSDLDFIVVFEKGKKTYENFIGLLQFLEDLFDMEIDLITKESLSPYILPYVEKEIIYETI